MKVYFSQPMRGKSETYILALQEMAADALRRHFEEAGELVEIIDSYRPEYKDASPLWAIGESLKQMAQADLVAFLPGWAEARGCRVEHYAAYQYRKPYVYYNMTGKELVFGTFKEDKQ